MLPLVHNTLLIITYGWVRALRASLVREASLVAVTNRSFALALVLMARGFQPRRKHVDGTYVILVHVIRLHVDLESDREQTASTLVKRITHVGVRKTRTSYLTVL